MEFWFILVAIVITISGIMVYAAVAAFFPEWVGITGRVAKDAQKSHVEGQDSFEWFDSTK